jgi:hypothetical protein
MGDVHFLSHAKTAQHAYVKALEIESKVRLRSFRGRTFAFINLSRRLLQHGRISGYSIFIMMTLNLQMKRSTVLRPWILTMLLPGLVRR